MEARLTAAAVERAYFTGAAMPVTASLQSAITGYAAAVQEHTDASEALLALAHVEGMRAEQAAAGRRLLIADGRRDASARELADEVLVAVGIP